MKKSAAIKIIVGMFVLSTNHALADKWTRVVLSDPTGSEVSEKINELGLFCEFLVSAFDGHSVLAACRDQQNADSTLGLYVLSSSGNSLTKDLLFSLGDATRASPLEFHSPKTVVDHLKPQLKEKIDERIVLVDVNDEGGCYATEVFHLTSGKFEHLGSIDFSVLSYTMHLDVPVYETRTDCLGKYSRVSSGKDGTHLVFSSEQIHRTDPDTGNLIQLKESELVYKLSPSKLERIQ